MYRTNLSRRLFSALAVAVGCTLLPTGAMAQNAGFEVRLDSVGPARLDVIRHVRTITGLGLRESRDLVDRAPAIVLASARTSEAFMALRRLSGSGAAASIRPVAAAPVTPPLADQPFLMLVQDKFSIPGAGTVLTGSVRRGTVSVGDAVELVGPEGRRASLITRIDRDRETVSTARPGDPVGLFLRGIVREDAARGMAVAATNSIAPRIAFRARLSDVTGALPSPDGGDGRSGEVSVWNGAVEVTGRWSLPDDLLSMPAGDTFDVHIALSSPTPLLEEMEILLRTNGRIVAKGVVEEILF